MEKCTKAVVYVTMAGILLIIFQLVGNSVYAQTEFKLTASDAANYDWLGYSVCISENCAVIGAYGDDVLRGSAYIFRYDGTSWSQEAKLIANDRAQNDDFGYSVYINGNLIVIGAIYEDDGGDAAGAAYIFRYNGTNWSQEAKLIASDAANYDSFGYSVSIDGNCAIIGSFGDDGMKGSAYIFRYDGTNWAQEAKLTASDGVADDWFGCAVAISGDCAIVGAYSDDGGKGSSYIFRYDGASWNQETKLTASDADYNDLFGNSVSIRGDMAVIGAYGDDGRKGAAYIFTFDGTSWTQEAKLTANDRADDDRFGFSVSYGDECAVIGAYGDDDGGEKAGSSYIFKYNGTTWIQEAKLTASDAAGGDQFGVSVSTSGNYVLVGANGDDVGNGAAYVYDLLPPILEVNIDIKPGSYPNPINLSSEGVIPVAILGDATFDVHNIDQTTLEFEGNSVRMKGKSGNIGSFDDVNEDGYIDLVIHFPVEGLDLTPDDTQAILRGELYDGTVFEGIDEIMIVPPTHSDEDFNLYQNSPNPFNPITKIRFDLLNANNVSLVVYNCRGDYISTLLDRMLPEGQHEVVWDGRNYAGEIVSSGIYFITLKAGESSTVKKALFLR